MKLNSNTSATWCEELTHLKRSWCWERLRAGREGDNRGWDGWMASLTRWTWVWVDSGSWWWTGRPGVLWFMGLQRVEHDWVTELNWTESWAQAEMFPCHLSLQECWFVSHAPFYECLALPGPGLIRRSLFQFLTWHWSNAVSLALMYPVNSDYKMHQRPQCSHRVRTSYFFSSLVSLHCVPWLLLVFLHSPKHLKDVCYILFSSFRCFVGEILSEHQFHHVSKKWIIDPIS